MFDLGPLYAMLGSLGVNVELPQNPPDAEAVVGAVQVAQQAALEQANIQVEVTPRVPWATYAAVGAGGLVLGLLLFAAFGRSR